jgi:hypothetical protein
MSAMRFDDEGTLIEEPRAVARRGDPGTSWEAARSVEHIRESQAEVLGMFRGRSWVDEELVEALLAKGSRQSPSGIRTRRRELVDLGEIVDTGRKRRGKTGRWMIVWRQATGCSCGRGVIGHTTLHESTEREGIVRIVRAGKTDQYVNVGLAEAEAQATARAAGAEEERRVLASTPRVDPTSHRVTFGGPRPCEKCGGTGGSRLEMCYRCDGTGLR